MTNAELQIAIDAIRNATADGSITNVMEADIMDALKSNNIPLSGTTEGNPVTGPIELGIENDGVYGKLMIKDDLLSLSNQNETKVVNISGFYDFENGGSLQHEGFGQFRIEGVEGDSVGLYSNNDYSEIDPTNKLIYAQRSYVENPETLINALNNCDSTQLDTIKTILGII